MDKTRHNFLSNREFHHGRNLPEAELNLLNLNGSYWESWPSDFIAQGRQWGLAPAQFVYPTLV